MDLTLTFCCWSSNFNGGCGGSVILDSSSANTRRGLTWKASSISFLSLVPTNLIENYLSNSVYGCWRFHRISGTASYFPAHLQMKFFGNHAESLAAKLSGILLFGIWSRRFITFSYVFLENIINEGFWRRRGLKGSGLVMNYAADEERGKNYFAVNGRIVKYFQANDILFPVSFIEFRKV